jgi:cytochrome c
MEGKPLTRENSGEASAAGSSTAIDVNAKSDSKGVGKFANATIKVGPGIDAAMAAKGKAIFQTSCTACHTATTQKLIGPGLKGITDIRTPQWIMNMISDPVKMTHGDPVAEALLQQENGVQMTNQNVGDDGAREILEFLRQNDAQ